MTTPQPSNYLAQWNPHRLIAFFKYCDCAALAVSSIDQLNLNSPLERMAASMMMAMRDNAIDAALGLFNSFIPSFPRSWPKRS